MKKEIVKVSTKIDKQKLRRKWEFMKRSKEYIEDFKDLRKNPANNYFKMFDKYKTHGPFPDPNGPSDAKSSFPKFAEYFNKDILDFWILNENDTSILKNSGIEEMGIELSPPMDYLKKKGESLKLHPGGDIDWERTMLDQGGILTYDQTHWLVYSKSKRFVWKLNEDNCPHSFTLNIRVNPALQKEDAKYAVLGVFNELWDIIAEAQKSLSKGTFLKPFRPRWDLYDKYIQVYDLKKANPKMQWSEIAKIVIPEEVEKHRAPHRKTRKTELPPKTTIDKVRHYWKEANKMINKEGWKKI